MFGGIRHAIAALVVAAAPTTRATAQWMCPGSLASTAFPANGVFEIYFNTTCNTSAPARDTFFGSRQDITIYGRDALLNGSITTTGPLAINDLTITGRITSSGPRLSVASVDTTSDVAVVAVETSAHITITNSTAVRYVAALAHLTGQVTVSECRANHPTRVIVQEMKGRATADFVKNWDECVDVIDLGALLNVFGQSYEVVFENGPFFNDQATLPGKILLYATVVTLAGIALLFLTHAGELTTIAHVYSSRLSLASRITKKAI